MFRYLHVKLRNANVGCLGAAVFVILIAAAIFGLILMAWWPYLRGAE